MLKIETKIVGAVTYAVLSDGVRVNVPINEDTEVDDLITKLIAWKVQVRRERLNRDIQEVVKAWRAAETDNPTFFAQLEELTGAVPGSLGGSLPWKAKPVLDEKISETVKPTSPDARFIEVAAREVKGRPARYTLTLAQAIRLATACNEDPNAFVEEGDNAYKRPYAVVDTFSYVKAGDIYRVRSPGDLTSVKHLKVTDVRGRTACSLVFFEDGSWARQKDLTEDMRVKPAEAP